MKSGECAGPGLKTAPTVVELRCRARGKIHAAVFAVEQRRIRRAFVILRLRQNRPIRQSRQRLNHQRRAFARQHGKQLRCGLFRPNLVGLLEQNRPRVEAFFEKHRGVAGECVAHGDGPLDGRGAAILRQQRRVQIDAAQPRQRQHPRRNDAAIGHNHNRVRRDGFECSAKLRVVADLFRLRHRNSGGKGRLLHGRRGELLAAAHGTVGLRNHESDRVSRGERAP